MRNVMNILIEQVFYEPVMIIISYVNGSHAFE